MQAALTAAAKERRALSSSLYVAEDNAPAQALYM